MNIKRNLLLLFALSLTACGPATYPPSATLPPLLITDTPTMVPGLQLPDLVVTFINVAMVDMNGQCLNGYYVQATVLNQGILRAENIVVLDLASGQQIMISKLEPAESVQIQIPAVGSSASYIVQVDPMNSIPELNETNNNLAFLLPTPTPFAPCLSVIPSDSTPTPIPPPFFTPPSTPELSSYFPMFSPPANWVTYSNPEPPYDIQIPPEATLEITPGKLIIHLPFNKNTQMEDKSITIETHPDSIDNCYATTQWEGKTLLNGADIKYAGGKQWEHAAGGLSFVMGIYASYQNGICYTIQSRLGSRDSSTFIGSPPYPTPLPTPSRADLDFEILLDILTTLHIH